MQTQGSPAVGSRVSVVMSTLNRDNTVSRAIDSVLCQDYPHIELVVVDDGSSDTTPEVLAVYASDPRVTVLRNQKNLGLPAALNRGVKESTGEFIARIDDDDYWHVPQKLSRQVAYMLQHPRCGLVGTGYLDEWGREIANPETDAAIRQQMLFRCPFCHPSVLMRRAALEESGGYDETLSYAEDWELWLRIGRTWQLGNLPDISVTKELVDASLSERHFLTQLGTATDFARRFSPDYPRAWRALTYHYCSRAFFALFRPGSGPHRLLRRIYLRSFGLSNNISAL